MSAWFFPEAIWAQGPQEQHLHLTLNNYPTNAYSQKRDCRLWSLVPLLLSNVPDIKQNETKQKPRTKHKGWDLLCWLWGNRTLDFLPCFVVTQAQWTAPDLNISSCQGCCKAGCLITSECFFILCRRYRHTEKDTLIVGGRERMGDRKHVFHSWEGLALGNPDREELRRGVDPQLALILKVIRSHLRKGGI